MTTRGTNTTFKQNMNRKSTSIIFKITCQNANGPHLCASKTLYNTHISRSYSEIREAAEHLIVLSIILK